MRCPLYNSCMEANPDRTDCHIIQQEQQARLCKFYAPYLSAKQVARLERAKLMEKARRYFELNQSDELR